MCVMVSSAEPDGVAIAAVVNCVRASFGVAFHGRADDSVGSLFGVFGVSRFGFASEVQVVLVKNRWFISAAMSSHCRRGCCLVLLCVFLRRRTNRNPGLWVPEHKVEWENTFDFARCIFDSNEKIELLNDFNLMLR